MAEVDRDATEPSARRRPVVLPPSSAISAAELEIDRWVLLEPPSRRFTNGIRLLALLFPAVTAAALLVVGATVDGGRAWWQWTLLVVGVLLGAAGCVRLWRCAARARPIDVELLRLTPSTGPERRRVIRLLRRGGPLTGTDRPAAAAESASRRSFGLQAGLWLAVTGFLLVLDAATTATGDVLAWLPPGTFAVGTLGWLALNHRADAVMRAADRAGVAPLVSSPPDGHPDPRTRR